jgi:hypothetical protein
MFDGNFDDLSLTEVPFTYQGAKYILREANAEASRKFRNANMRAIKMRDGKAERIENQADAESQLVADCLFEKISDSKEKPVSLPVVLGWPDRVTDWLYRKVREISPTLSRNETKESLTKEIEQLQKKLAALEKNGTLEEQAKNAPSATTSISS